MKSKQWAEDRNKLFRLRGMANANNPTNLFIEMKKVIPKIENEEVKQDLVEAYNTSPSESNRRKQLIQEALSTHLRSHEIQKV